jgi:hypothetical protein
MFASRTEAAMTTFNNAYPDRERPDQGLDRRYGKIEIPAVAAALRYPPATNNCVRAPAASGERRRDEQACVAPRG